MSLAERVGREEDLGREMPQHVACPQDNWEKRTLGDKGKEEEGWPGDRACHSHRGWEQGRGLRRRGRRGGHRLPLEAGERDRHSLLRKVRREKDTLKKLQEEEEAAAFVVVMAVVVVEELLCLLSSCTTDEN